MTKNSLEMVSFAFIFLVITLHSLYNICDNIFLNWNPFYMCFSLHCVLNLFNLVVSTFILILNFQFG
jgi:hypothetical protein